MWVESSEWMKFGGKAFFCLTVSGLLKRERTIQTWALLSAQIWNGDFGGIVSHLKWPHYEACRSLPVRQLAKKILCLCLHKRAVAQRLFQWRYSPGFRVIWQISAETAETYGFRNCCHSPDRGRSDLWHHVDLIVDAHHILRQQKLHVESTNVHFLSLWGFFLWSRVKPEVTVQ